MKNMYFFPFLIALFLPVAGSLQAQCLAATEAAFLTCLSNNATAIELTAPGNGTININSAVDLSGVSINLSNDDIFFNDVVTIDANTSFSGNGSANLTVGGTTFSGSGTSPTLDELNTAIMNCGCTTLAAAAAFLPVELLYFSGKPERNSVLLDWATSSESDNEFFLVEYSTDGINFREIGTVSSQGDSQTNQYYRYRHVPTRAAQHYYRLWQHDLDGTVAELGIVTVKLDGNGQSAGVYPNPVSKNQLLRLNNVDATSTLNLISGNGRQWQLSLSGDNQVALPAGLATGLYYLRITSANGEQTVPVNVVR